MTSSWGCKIEASSLDCCELLSPWPSHLTPTCGNAHGSPISRFKAFSAFTSMWFLLSLPFLWKIFLKFYYVCIRMNVYVCVCHTCGYLWRSEEATGSQRWSSQLVVCSLMWVLATELRSSRTRVTSALTAESPYTTSFLPPFLFSFLSSFRPSVHPFVLFFKIGSS